MRIEDYLVGIFYTRIEQLNLLSFDWLRKYIGRCSQNNNYYLVIYAQDKIYKYSYNYSYVCYV